MSVALHPHRHHHAIKLAKQRRMEECITQIGKLDTIYLLGGARVMGVHGKLRIAAPVGANLPWTDCSGAGAYVGMVGGLHIPALCNAEGGAIWTGTEADIGIEGESDYFTLFLKEPDNVEGHVIMRLRERPHWSRGSSAPRYRWAECGGRDNPKSGGGLHWFKPTPERIAEFPIHRCFKGF